MLQLQAPARLVDSTEAFSPGGAVGVTLARAELEQAAAAGDFPAHLALDVRRIADGSEDEARVTLEWDEQLLNDVLRAASGDEVTLVLDRAALEEALDAEVEAHGVRERAAVLAIAVAAAGSIAGGALAHPEASSSGSGGSAATATGGAGGDTVLVAPGTRYAALPGQTVQAAPDGGTQDVVLVAKGTHYAALPDETVQPAADAGATDVVLVPPGERYAALPDQTAQPAAAAPQEDVVLAPAGARYAPLPGQTVQAAPGDVAQPVAVSEPQSGTLSTGEDAAIAAGTALVIAAAGFVAAQTRRRPAKHA